MHIEGGHDALVDEFWSVARRLRHASMETVAPWDITPSHARALGAMLHHGAMRLSALADHLHIAPRSVTEVIDALEERGLVARQSDPDDRRATVVTLTDAGRDTGEQIHTARSAEATRFFSVLSADDRAELSRILRQLRD